jgi:isopenicillin-N N-acyltransferase-like protein
MRGMADASGADYHKILGVHMIGEVTKGSCSMFGAWGTATASTGSLLQLRALDWDVDGPFKNFPQITVYHATNSSDGNSFANVGWTGWMGSITGINDKRMVNSIQPLPFDPVFVLTL